MRLGVFGEEGSFSEEAGLAWAEGAGLRAGEDVRLLHLVSLEGLLVALEKDHVDRALLPVANSRAGLVLPAFEALGRHRFRPVEAVTIKVRQALCARSAAVDPTAVLAVVSHPHALSQCARALDARFPGAQRVAWSDTASAARDLALGVLPAESTLVIASHRAAARFELHVLEPDLQDEPDNRTTFLIVEAGA